MSPFGVGSVLARTAPSPERPPAQRWAIRVVWIGFVAFPLVDAITASASALEKAAVIAAAVLFVVVYVLLLVAERWNSDRRAATAILVLLALASFLSSFQSPGWGFLFIYSAACCGLVRDSRLGFCGVALSALLAGAVTGLAGGGAGNSIGFGAGAAGIGMLMLLVRDLRVRNEELCEARAELARVAVARERERFARDLHDLLGHSLSVIAIKAELARRLVGVDGERAAEEVADIEAVARQALAEVRQAVSGYRRPSLAGELEGARVALEAAGIASTIDPGVTISVDDEREAVLAWAVREGATNVIRHSAARSCSVRVVERDGEAVVEVTDDGVVAGVAPAALSAASAGPAGGHGLDGLRERVEAVGGTVVAGAQPGGGYRLAVSVPTAAVPA